MKILHISSARVTYPGGTERVLWEIATRQAKIHSVTILQTNLYEEGKKIIEEEERENIRIITCQNSHFLGGFGYSPEFKKKLKEIWKEFDIIHIHGHGRFTSIYALGFLNGKKPIIYSAQGFFHDKKHYYFKKIYDIIFTPRLRKANFCTALTKLEKIKLESMKVSPKKIKIIPGGINFKKIQIKKSKTELRKKILDKNEINKKIILYVGRIHQSKGIHKVIEAIKNIDNILFLIVGKDAGYLNNLQEIVKNFKLEEKVKFIGAVDDNRLLELYNLADIFALYSDWEGFGLVIIEAMAAGVPAIVSNNGSLPTLVKNNFNGIVAKNLEELRSGIIKLMDDKKRKILEKNSREFARKFDWDNIVKQHLNIYKIAIKENE